MNRTMGGNRLRDLLRLLDALATMNEQLYTLIGTKIDAMKRADLHAMRECGARERDMVRNMHEREGFRRQLMDAIGEDWGLSPRSARELSVTQLASRLAGSQGTALSEAAGRVRKAVFKVTQANRVAGVVCREILHHLKWIFASVRPGDEKPAEYAGDGVMVPSRNTPMFETVG